MSYSNNVLHHLNMYIRFVTFKFPSKSKAEAFISMMSTPIWQEKVDRDTKCIDQIIIRSGEGKLAGMGIYKTKEDFLKSSKMLKEMFVDLVKSFEGILEWHDGNVVFHYKRKKK